LRLYREGLGFSSDCIIAQEFEHGTIAFINCNPAWVRRSGRAAASRMAAGWRSTWPAPPK